MVHVFENVSLKGYNTFGIDVSSRWFAEINSEDDLLELFSNPAWRTVDRFVLGGGSNVLFTKNFDGLILRINIPGIRDSVDGNRVIVTAGAGVVWKDLVNYCVDQGYSGIENLSLIPGSVGASPIQNIGAYGVELKDVFESCRAFEIATGKFTTFSKAACSFGYRDSIFKNTAKGQFIITEVSFGLSLTADKNISYGAISAELKNRGIENPSVKDISEVVSSIRVSKLPDPSTIGNAGSFFKNPVVDAGQFERMQSVFPDIVHFSLPDGTEKIAAGWMIEKLGWKGKKIGEAGTWKNQALVLVNYGNATGSAIYDISSQIIRDVSEQFGILLEREVNIL